MDNEWHHLAVSWAWESGETKLYLDGQEKTPFWASRAGAVVVGGGLVELRSGIAWSGVEWNGMRTGERGRAGRRVLNAPGLARRSLAGPVSARLAWCAALCCAVLRCAALCCAQLFVRTTCH